MAAESYHDMLAETSASPGSASKGENIKRK
jgi:hypothetical protein